MNIDDLTIKEAREISAMFGNSQATQTTNPCGHDKKPVVVCTDKRGVIFGYTENVDARPINLTNARMCLYWSKVTGGVFGLAENGPNESCKISAVVPSISLEGVTAIMSVDDNAVNAWEKAKVQGR